MFLLCRWQCCSSRRHTYWSSWSSAEHRAAAVCFLWVHQ